MHSVPRVGDAYCVISSLLPARTFVFHFPVYVYWFCSVLAWTRYTPYTTRVSPLPVHRIVQRTPGGCAVLVIQIPLLHHHRMFIHLFLFTSIYFLSPTLLLLMSSSVPSPAFSQQSKSTASQANLFQLIQQHA